MLLIKLSEVVKIWIDKPVENDSIYFPVAERLLRMLKYFDDMPDQWVPCNSLRREFIGGSCYAD